MPLINTPVAPFKATAFHNGKFVEITEQTLKGRWSVFVFYPADFTFVCPTELEDLADRHDQFKALGVDVYGISTDTHLRPGTTRHRPSSRSSSSWSATRRVRSRAISA